MSTGSQVVPANEYVSRVFEKQSSLALRSNCAIARACLAVLLVGRSGSWSSRARMPLEHFGSELSFAAPQVVTPKFVRNGAYNLLLLDSTVPPAQRRLLAAKLAGSEVSIFYSFPVEDDCWWVPALRRGQDCHGAPAFRRKEFPFELERILRDQEWRKLQPAVVSPAAKPIPPAEPHAASLGIRLAKDATGRVSRNQ
jgi:hypothetical protein